MDHKSLLFSGHETFALKYEWLRKFYEAGDENLSNEDDILVVRFGVGRNMLNSIRYWAKLSGLFIDLGGQKSIVPKANKCGQKIFEKLDPYLEQDATTWFLHWKMIFEGEAYTPSWLFRANNINVFDAQQILNEMKTSLLNDGRTKPPADETLKRDIDTYLRCYCPKRNKSNEEVDYIFADLDLITHADDGTSRYQMSYQERPTLSYQMFLYALIEFKKICYANSKYIPMEKVMYGDRSPGRIFRLDERSINYYSEEIGRRTSEKIILDESSGVYQWLFNMDDEHMMDTQDSLFGEMYGHKKLFS
jgi:hypothetical protein